MNINAKIMMVAAALALASGTAHAELSEEGLLIGIGAGASFVALQDINLPANSNRDDSLSKRDLDNFSGVRSCFLSVTAVDYVRVIQKDTVMKVKATETKYYITSTLKPDYRVDTYSLNLSGVALVCRSDATSESRALGPTIKLFRDLAKGILDLKFAPPVVLNPELTSSALDASAMKNLRTNLSGMEQTGVNW